MINERNVKAYCCEDISKIENYEEAVNDKTQTWDCHHRLEETIDVQYTQRYLADNGLYWHRPASELIFIKRSEHMKLHGKNQAGERNSFFGRTQTAKCRRAISESNKRRFKRKENHPMFGRKHTEESIRKMSESHKGKKWSDERKAKKVYWFNNGEINTVAESCPEGFVRGKLKKEKMHWYNNGKVNVMAKECPEGFVKGMLPKSKSKGR